jgi:uncharacterized lipoprotein YddW (UPF0748 family)
MRKELYVMAGIVLVGVALCSCKGGKKEKKEEYPMFWTWLDYKAGTFDSMCVMIKEAGIDGVMLNTETPEEMREALEVAEKYGIAVYAWLWTLNLDHKEREEIPGKHHGWMSVNRYGWSLADSMAYVKYYKFMCPALPEVQSYVLGKVYEYCKIEGLKGISIDYNRLVDVILPSQLWEHYGIMQDKEYGRWDYGYHSSMAEKFMGRYGYDPRRKEAPEKDSLWLKFRCEQVTEVANLIAETVHSFKKVMAASPFPTPGMARALVRQDWGKWNLDIVFPMVYHSMYTGEKGFIGDCMIKNVEEKGEKTELYCGILLEERDSLEVIEYMEEALNNGAKGVAIFTVEALRSAKVREEFREYADKMREKRALGEIPVETLREVEIDPFKKEGVMGKVEAKMASYMEVEKEEMELGEYVLKEEYGVTKRYEVKEGKSGTRFDVWFFFHGGIVSGWIVKPEGSVAGK